MKSAWRLWVGLGLLLAGTAGAQTNTGTSIGDFLLIEPSARIAGMGNAGVAGFEGLPSVYYNAAAIGLLQNSVEVSHSSWIADISHQYIAASVRAGGSGSVFASVTALNSGEMDVRTVEQPLGTGERFSVSDVAIGLGYGRQISDRFSAGIIASYVQESIWHSSVSTLTLNLGTLYKVSEGGLHIGASISNLGTRAAFSGRDLRIVYDTTPDTHGDNSQLPGEVFTTDAPVPIVFRVGLGMPLQVGRDAQLHLEADAFHPSDNTESLSLGGEFTWKNSVSLRAGYQNLWQQDSEEGLTLGAGFQGKGEGYSYHADYAWADEGRLESTHRISVGVTF